MASNDLVGTVPPRMVDNATIVAYNSDSKHRIRRTHMTDSPTNPTLTLEHETEQLGPETETETVVAAP